MDIGDSTGFLEAVRVERRIGSPELLDKPIRQVAPCAHSHGRAFYSLGYQLEVLFCEAHLLVPFLVKAGVVHADLMERIQIVRIVRDGLNEAIR